ncbi:helix-turn-helix transcriptional regulator [Paenibacillus antri]|uniref:Helix-turn-helix transcriptional regulator n=1 Tax=Paenibacillus antri TaxID=2582848 RepID=A0A5R9G126_9BACL|nr:helix-turn-helix transcriptional regulator [Paenibacillus antri]TLS50032.1 helix-turn-helix transcriptional regulator [Paenibacillus antri]
MPENVLVLLGKRIRDLRKEQGLSQEQLAELSGFHYTYIGAVERAEKNITVMNVSKIAAALAVSVSDLFSYSKISDTTQNKSRDIEDIVQLLLKSDHQRVRKIKNVILQILDED